MEQQPNVDNTGLPPKPTMTREDRDRKQFEVARYWADDELSNQRVYIAGDNFLEKTNHRDLLDARCLYRMILKEIEEHNSKVKTKQTLRQNLRYSSKWQSSKVFSGMSIPIKQIDKLINDNPDKNSYELYRMLKGW